MRARYHGEHISTLEAKSLPKAMPGVVVKPSVGYMFGKLASYPANRLPEGPATIEALSALGIAMAEDPSNAESGIPAAYTYFGQFIDHDITKTVFDASIQPADGTDIIQAASFQPLSQSDVASKVTNARSPVLELDSVYDGLAEDATQANGAMDLGTLSVAPFGTITTADRLHDLPRRPLIANPANVEEQELDRQALIGDPRNDENLLVAQLHVGFLRSHNALMARGMTGPQAKSAIRRRYQWAVLHDFLPRVCDKAVVKDVIDNGPKYWKVANAADLYMPVEFSAAAYRFGHSMVRGGYSHNVTFNPAPFNFFFTFTALSGDIAPSDGPNIQSPTLPDNWVIDWPRFFGTAGNDASINPARRIDANLTPELGNLRDLQGIPIASLMAKLAARNLLRGYLLGLPTGQAVANHLEVAPLPRAVLKSATPSGLSQKIEDAGLLDRTPLWFYILAEAGDPNGPDGQHLGPVGSRIVAETLWNLAKFAPDSVIGTPPSQTELDSGEFTLKGLIKIGQDTGMPPLVV